MQDQGKNLIFQHQNKSFTILSSKFALAIGIYPANFFSRKTSKTFGSNKNNPYLCKRFKETTTLSQGEMVEWSITAVLKTAVLRGTGGSNPSLSANKGVNQQVMRFTPFSTPKNLL